MDFGQRNKVETMGTSYMTDLVFLLLLFFVILSTRVVNGEQVDLPQTASGPVDLPKATITITSDNRIQLNNKEVQQEELPSKLNAMYLGAAPDDKTVIINGDFASNFGIAIEIMSAVDELGFDVSVATRPKKK